MLKQRLITACALLALLLVVLFLLPPAAFEFFIALVLLGAAWEWGQLAGLESRRARVAGVVCMALVLWYGRELPPSVRQSLLPAALVWWLLALVLVLAYPRLSTLWDRSWLLVPAAVPVLVPGWLALLQLRGADSFEGLFLWLLALVVAADTGAYFSGRRFGRRKLAAAVSPSKTWEGAAGGLLAVCVVAWSGLPWYGGDSPYGFLRATAGAVLLGACSIVGDLFESMLKRQRQLKDSGTLLPGHGGVLDRIDSLSAALPVYVVLLEVAFR